jgi:uncharacterized membrane protein YphA (DoxX/SURF4 family)
LFIRLGVGVPGVLGSAWVISTVWRMEQMGLSSAVPGMLGASSAEAVSTSLLSLAVAIALIAGAATRLVAAYGIVMTVGSRLDVASLSQAMQANMVHGVGEALPYLFHKFSLGTVTLLLAYLVLVGLGPGRWSLDARIATWRNARRRSDWSAEPGELDTGVPRR